jgi:hypothetical protein
MSVSSRRSEAPKVRPLEINCPQSAGFCEQRSTSNRNPNGPTKTHPPAWHRKCSSTFRHEAVTRAHLPSSISEVFLRRADLLKPDVMSQVILLGAGALMVAILVLILIVVLTQASAPI